MTDRRGDASGLPDASHALQLAVDQIRKRHGPGAIMQLGDHAAAATVDTIPTGALTLDLALGIGGILKGRVTELYGPEATCKTTLALHLIANAQRLGGRAAFIHAEHALDPASAAAIGVDTDAVLVSQPDHAEQALDVAETLVRSAGVAIVVVDSVAALVPKAELEGDVGDPFLGLAARSAARIPPWASSISAPLPKF